MKVKDGSRQITNSLKRIPDYWELEENDKIAMDVKVPQNTLKIIELTSIIIQLCT